MYIYGEILKLADLSRCYSEVQKATYFVSVRRSNLSLCKHETGYWSQSNQYYDLFFIQAISELQSVDSQSWTSEFAHQVQRNSTNVQHLACQNRAICVCLFRYFCGKLFKGRLRTRTAVERRPRMRQAV